jgi:hypothetical protein
LHVFDVQTKRLKIFYTFFCSEHFQNFFNFIYLKTKYRLSRMYFPLVFMTSAQRLGRSRMPLKFVFLGPLRFQNFYPLSDCLTSKISDSQNVQGLANMGGGVAFPSQIRLFFL